MCSSDLIPEHLSQFGHSPRNAMRRACDVILVGESRDRETLWGMLEAAETGTVAYSTVHTQSVADTPTRIINVFPADMQQQVAGALISSLRLVIQQRLEPSPKGGRVAIKEYLAFDRDVREQLMHAGLRELSGAMDKLVEERGRPLIEDVRKKYEQGLIFKETLDKITKETERDDA